MKLHSLLDVRLVVTIAIVTLLCGCRSTKLVEVPVTHIEYKTRTDTVRDSIYHDVMVKEYLKGDTVFRDRTEYVYRDRWHAKTDTVCKMDTITKVVTVEKTSFVQSAVNKIMEWVLIAIVVLIALIVTIKWIKSKLVI